MHSALTTDGASFWVICLCAEWCNVCRDWRGIFEQSAREHPLLRFAWIDVEDEADAMGDVEIETFPTVLIARDLQPLFLGPVQPSGALLARLISSLREHGTGTDRAVVPTAAPLIKRLAAGVLPKP